MHKGGCMRRLLIMMVALLVACGGARAIDRATLEAALYQDGDAPQGWTAGQLRDRLNGNATGAEMVASRELHSPDGPAGDEVAIAVYPDVDAAIQGYGRLLPGVTTDGQPYEVGNEGRQRGNIVLFRRCRAVALVRMTHRDRDLTQLGTYARRLDERLTPLVC